MNDIIDDLVDLIKQATKENSHYYVASVCSAAIAEISKLRIEIHKLTERKNQKYKPQRIIR